MRLSFQKSCLAWAHVFRPPKCYHVDATDGLLLFIQAYVGPNLFISRSLDDSVNASCKAPPGRGRRHTRTPSSQLSPFLTSRPHEEGTLLSLYLVISGYLLVPSGRHYLSTPNSRTLTAGNAGFHETKQ